MRLPRQVVDCVVSAVLLFSGVSPLVTSTEARAGEPQVAPRRAQAPGVYRHRVGDFQVTALSDGTVPLDLHTLLQGISHAELDRTLFASFLTNPVETSITAYLIDTGSRLILVDAGAGTLFGPGYGGNLVSNLKAAGYSPDLIDDILITHIHTDHSGGLTVEGQRIFPNATVHVGRADVDFFLNPANQGGTGGYDAHYFQEATKTVGPYQKAGKVRTFSQETWLYPGIKALPTPGHTPGHAFFLVESRGESLQFIGDVVHVASVQFANPPVTVGFDVQPREAAAQRAKQFAAAARSRVLVAAPHLPYPGLGHLRAEDRGFTFVPVDYRDR